MPLIPHEKARENVGTAHCGGFTATISCTGLSLRRKLRSRTLVVGSSGAGEDGIGENSLGGVIRGPRSLPTLLVLAAILLFRGCGGSRKRRNLRRQMSRRTAQRPVLLKVAPRGKHRWRCGRRAQDRCRGSQRQAVQAQPATGGPAGFQGRLPASGPHRGRIYQEGAGF